MANLSNQEKVELLRKTTLDFDDVDVELSEKLEKRLTDALQEAMDELRKELTELSSSQYQKAGGYNSKAVREKIDEAVKNFKETWEKKAKEILVPELKGAIDRGIMQAGNMILVTDEETAKLAKIAKKGE